MCVGPDQQHKAVDVAAAAATFFDHMPLPLPDPSVQPANGGVVNIPALFAVQHEPMTRSFDLGGLRVTVEAHPAYWDWTFDPGATRRFTKPGGPYPDRDVNYTYVTPGTRDVTVTATWTARFRVGDQPDWYDVNGTVSRTSAPLPVRVDEAQSHLVSG